jgi:crotonobetainyl-CoA:carnitine CoA-transferase CaiB-like acyl-CoA transferase
MNAHAALGNQSALAGIKVVEMGQLLAGPFCGQLLGDMGARGRTSPAG